MSGLDQADHRLGDMGNLLSPAGTDYYFLWEVRLRFWLKSEHDPLSQRTEIKASLYFSVWRGHTTPVILLYHYSILVPEVSIHRIWNSAQICFEWWAAKLSPHMSDLSFSLSSSRDNNLNSNKPTYIPSRFSLMFCAEYWLQHGAREQTLNSLCLSFSQWYFSKSLGPINWKV